MLKFIAAPALALATLCAAFSSLAAEPKPAPKVPAAPAVPASGLDLTPAQRQRVEASRAESERLLAPLREQLAARRQELHALWTAEKPDRAAILKKEAELDGLRQKMRAVLLDQRLAYLAVLTPEQRAAWRTGPRGGMGNMHGGMGGPGGMGNMHGGMGGPGGMGNMHGGMGGPGGMHGSAPRPELMGAEDCMGYLDCGVTCTQPPPPPAPPAAPAPAKPAGAAPGAR